MPHPRTPGQRAGLTHDRVLAAARELLADRGLEALTMRALAERLGVRANALYSHVKSKTALLDDVLDDVLAEVESPSPDAPDPRQGLHAMMVSTHEVLLAHPDLVPAYLARQGARGPNAQRLGDVMLALLERAGVGGARAIEARRVLIVYTIGFAAFATRPLFEPGDETRVGGEPGDETRAGDEPETREGGAGNETRLDDSFERGLEWLLAGITA